MDSAQQQRKRIVRSSKDFEFWHLQFPEERILNIDNLEDVDQVMRFLSTEGLKKKKKNEFNNNETINELIK